MTRQIANDELSSSRRRPTPSFRRWQVSTPQAESQFDFFVALRPNANRRRVNQQLRELIEFDVSRTSNWRSKRRKPVDIPCSHRLVRVNEGYPPVCGAFDSSLTFCSTSTRIEFPKCWLTATAIALGALERDRKNIQLTFRLAESKTWPTSECEGVVCGARGRAQSLASAGIQNAGRQLRNPDRRARVAETSKMGGQSR